MNGFQDDLKKRVNNRGWTLPIWVTIAVLSSVLNGKAQLSTPVCLLESSTKGYDQPNKSLMWNGNSFAVLAVDDAYPASSDHENGKGCQIKKDGDKGQAYSLDPWNYQSVIRREPAVIGPILTDGGRDLTSCYGMSVFVRGKQLVAIERTESGDANPPDRVLDTASSSEDIYGPAISYLGRGYWLVVWAKGHLSNTSSSETKLYACWVNDGMQHSTPNAIKSAAGKCFFAPALATIAENNTDPNNTTVLLAYEQAYPESSPANDWNWDIYATLLSGTACISASEESLSQTSDAETQPRVCYAPKHNKALVVWEKRNANTKDHDLNGMVCSISAQPNNYFISTGSKRSLVNSSKKEYKAAAAYDYINDRHLMAYTLDYNESDQDVKGLFISPETGLAVGSSFSISGSGDKESDPAITFGTDSSFGAFQLTWKHQQATYGRIYGRQYHVKHLTSIEVNGPTEPNGVLYRGHTYVFSCIASYSDGTTSDITSSANWTTDIANAHFNAPGQIVIGEGNAEFLSSVRARFLWAEHSLPYDVDDEPLSLAISPTSHSYGSGPALNQSFSVTANTSWTATENLTWLTITSGSSGNGNGTVKYQVSQNYGSSRSGTVTVRGGGITRTFTVTQDATKTLAIDPPSRTHTSSSADNQSISVSANVSWNAETSFSWLRITSGSSGNGNGTVRYAVDANNGTTSRSGAIAISGEGISRSFSISQHAPNAPTADTVSIEGPSLITENSSGSYTCRVVYSDSSVGHVTCDAAWEENTDVTLISSCGVLTAQNVNADRNCTITCAYGGKTAALLITVKNNSTSVIPPPSGVSATDGTYSDKTRISWNSASGASHYKVYRSISYHGIKTSLSGWQTSRTYYDRSGTVGKTYNYWVRAATSSSGDNMSEYSTLDTGFSKLSAPASVSATDGFYPDKTRISWNSVSGASHYRVYRSTTYSGTKTSLCSWQSSRSYYDRYGDAGRSYYYWVKAATSAYGDKASEYSYPNRGWRKATPTPTPMPSTDEWDPVDDTEQGATFVSAEHKWQTHGPHQLSSDDRYDYFKIEMESGRSYIFDIDSTHLIYAYLRSSLYGTVSYDYGTSLHIAYRANDSRDYYLKLYRSYGSSSPQYSLKYRMRKMSASDYDGDGSADLATFASGYWRFYTSQGSHRYDEHSCAPGSIPFSGDFNGDGKTDYGTYYPPSGSWNIWSGSDKTMVMNPTFGYTGTEPVTGDFDGDGTLDFGCYYPETGQWYLYKSRQGLWTTQFGYGGTIPVTGDFDGDGVDDFGCFFAPQGWWYLFKSRDGFWTTRFGYSGTVPIVGDFDGDGVDDFGCYYAPEGWWYLYKSQDGFWTTQFGFAGTDPIVGDYDGDGIDDFGCYYEAEGWWYIFNSSTQSLSTYRFGGEGSVAVQ